MIDEMSYIDSESDTARIRPRYIHLLQPTYSSPYPINRQGPVIKVAKQYLDNWIDIKALTGFMLENSGSADVKSMFDDPDLSPDEKRTV